jgi:hypothetical protein
LRISTLRLAPLEWNRHREALVLAKLVSRLTYSNVMSSLAVFLVLSGGTAVALSGTNTVFSDDIVDGEVKKQDAGQDSVGQSEALDDNDPGGGFTGFQINESTLGKVPNADKLDGFDSAAFVQGNGRLRSNHLDRATNSAETSLFTIAGLGQVLVDCDAGPTSKVRYSNNTGGQVDGVFQTTAGTTTPGFGAGGGANASTTSALQVFIHLSSGTGTSAQFATVALSLFDDGTGCHFLGQAAITD